MVQNSHFCHVDISRQSFAIAFFPSKERRFAKTAVYDKKNIVLLAIYPIYK